MYVFCSKLLCQILVALAISRPATKLCVQEKEWQKEASVLWRYCDRLAALVDLMAAGRVAIPPKPLPSTLPRGSTYVTPLSTVISAATSRSCQASSSQRCHANDKDPGRIDAASLKRTLRAVAAIESYLQNSGRLDTGSSQSNLDFQASGMVADDDLVTLSATNRTGMLLLVPVHLINLPH
jgi:hypothetical protein